MDLRFIGPPWYARTALKAHSRWWRNHITPKFPALDQPLHEYQLRQLTAAICPKTKRPAESCESAGRRLTVGIGLRRSLFVVTSAANSGSWRKLRRAGCSQT